MSQPTQVLPSWLTLSTTVVTLPDGGISTSSTILRLPLTYFGPSIPLGTDGVWTYGGLTPPPSTTFTPTSATPTSTPVSSTITLAPTTSLPATSGSPLPASSSGSLSSSSSSSTTAVPTVASQASHGISPSTLGAILGSVLGTLLLLVLIAIIFLIRSNRRRHASADPRDPSSSFRNRSTTLMSSFRNSTLPIWTGWELVDADDAQSPRSPGEGSPRGSGEEDDPFLTRRSVHSGTDLEHARTDTDTLVSLPAIARTGTMSTHHSAPKPGGYIIPREVQMRMDEEMGDAPLYPSVRMVERRPSDDQYSPLLPPPPLDTLEPGGRRASLGSEKSKVTDNARSVMSEKSGDTDIHEPEGAELLTARRVRVGQPGPSSVATPNVLGLDRLANLGRMSWFKRMSFMGAPAGSHPVPGSEREAAASDSYTRTPPRHSRNGSHSRPSSNSRTGSFARISAHDPVPTTDSFGRRIRHDSGLGFGLTDDRPISTVSAQSATSGNTVFFDANSRPGSSMGTRSTAGSGATPVPPVPPVPAAHLVQPSPLSHEVRHSSGSMSTASSYGQEITDRPPTYESATAPQSRTGLEYSDIDVLDMPAPRPASPFSEAAHAPPPGLDHLPNPTVWRNSHSSSGTPTPATDSMSGINFDILEEAPPAARGVWLQLAGGLRPTDGRRTTFGVPMVVQPQDVLRSERGSLHSTRSHLSPYSSRSPSGSAPASSRHVGSGSSSSRPTASSHSRGVTTSSGGSLAHSNSVSFDDHRPGRHRAEVGEVASPPLSAVFGAFPRGAASPPPLGHGHGDDVILPAAPAYPSGAPSPIPVPGPVALSGTMTSTATRGTGDESLTDLSVTTTQTDPITGAQVHLPRLPWRSGYERPWGERPVREDTIW
ncbi:hypothetical protein K466DRAFT_563033 [Polyporus arcularius HHB13444]|uniref:Uncharacterized protein n=1 Tax=Polyporus arcularius HHB13444 TaxID=1314778 RepID=A0A5C3PYS6_9APHY|nr:hypothetical protein K466DRAFT_563033 [Polyporus arcularius HHB13444]